MPTFNDTFGAGLFGKAAGKRFCSLPITRTTGSTGGAFSLVEERARLGACTPRHVHTREAETFMVLDGALEGWCDGTATLVEAGSMIHLPAGREHAFRIASEAAHFYTLITPSGFESFFLTTGRPSGVPFDGDLPVPGPVPAQVVARLQEKLDPLGVTITGPPPFETGQRARNSRAASAAQ